MTGLVNRSGELSPDKTEQLLTEMLAAIEDLALSIRDTHGRERFPLEAAADHINRCRYLLGIITEMPPSHTRDRWPEGTSEE